jgi:serine/threonine-protein kinase
MGTEDFTRLEELFHAALAKPPEDREAFLASRCDEATTHLVKELLQANDEPWFINQPLVKSLAALDGGDIPAGTRIGDYEITERVGSGGMGHVYRARHLRLECDHAIKVLRGGEAQADERLLDEARHAAQLSHPNICKVYHVGQFEGRPYLVMEFVRGRTLEQRLAGGPLPFAAALRYAAQVADALVDAHGAGVIHGDLKPANIMVDGHGQVKVLDFGVARRVPAGGATPEPLAAGTLRYMPPEALRGEHVDARGDLWSLGVVVYEMIAGAPPFQGGTTSETSSSILRDTPPPFDSAVPPAIEPVVRRCLEKDVARRYQTAGEVRAALDAAGGTVLPRPNIGWRAWRWAAAVLLGAVLIAGAWLWRSRPPTSSSRVSIAVMPLESLSGEQDGLFADGVTEVLIGDLAQVRAIRVISRQSTLRYRGTSTSPAEIARTLGVNYLVKGTVTRAGSQVRVTAQLLDPFTDEHLWSNSITRPFEDLLTVQNEVARDIARHVTVTIRPEEERRFAQTRPVRPEVLEAYLKGRALWNSRSRRGLEQAADAFRVAIQLDPLHAQSHSGLADTYAVQASLGFARAREAYPLARAAALEALRLDPGLAEPHASLGRVKFSYDWDGRGAEEEFRRALTVNPGYATAHQWYAVFLATRGRLDEALQEARLAEESNPLSAIVHWNVARTQFFRREHQAAVEAVRRALTLDPDFAMAHLLAARILAQDRRFDDSHDALNRIADAERTSEALALDAYIAAARGDRTTALAIVKRLEALPASQHLLPYHLAKVYAALNESGQAFAHLQSAADEHSAQIVFMNIDPELAPLRSDRRFVALAERVGLIGR